MERTYVMVKPDGVQRGLVGRIITRIEERGLKITALKMHRLTPEQAREHYREHTQKPFFQSLVSFITSGPVVSMVVEGKNAVSTVRRMSGLTNPAEADPGTVRGDFALETGRNVIHASDSQASAAREISLHFREEEILDYRKIEEDWLYED